MATLIAASVLAVSLSSIQNILIVALGLGLVIFFHELGHFAVAKWCDVNVERFSIGFGPILLSWKWGETEYALSLIPFGGYVKMLGQDDADPSQLTSEEVAEDPRSYIAKSVPQRMAIISAGVIMNIITGLLFFAFAFQQGVEVPPSELGTVFVGKPAWEAGLREGDRLTEINGRDVSTFGDIIRATALSSSEYLDVKGVHYDGGEFEARIFPTMNGTRREIGVEPVRGLALAPKEFVPNGDATLAGTAANKASPPFKPGDEIVSLDGEKLDGFAGLQNYLARHRGDTVEFNVKRTDENNKSSDVEITVGPQGFRTLGLWMDIGQIEAVQVGSPAEKAGLKTGDKIVRIDDLDVGKDINPLTLPDYFAERHGQEISVVVNREEKGSGAKSHDLVITPLDIPGWIERPSSPNTPLSVQSIGIAFHMIPTVLKVQEGSPADGKVKAGDQIQQVELVLPKGTEKPDIMDKLDPVVIELNESNRNWMYAFWQLQVANSRDIRLKIARDGSTPELVTLTPTRAEDWFLPTRGIMMSLLSVSQKAGSFGEAIQMGVSHTKNSAFDIYLTLRNLITQNLSVKELHGPIGIAKVAYQVSQQGIAELSMFLGFLSINLAVLNFLPIPVLDGGHMVFLIYEGITRKKPSERVLIAATYIGMAFVLSLMVLVIFLDVFVHGF
ncbi:site-2 protease family protein [uncultured Rubinisphaera sp.]|uniref:site-2 protease family protein n=1 Tax=uncultured Rubinisphaera sp. TaxID=1678686 RepID=UPI0030D80526